MADNYLERHYQEYEKRKEEWLRKKKHLVKSVKESMHRRVNEGK